MSDCLFCKIIKGDISSYPIWQDENFLAILDKYPNIPGQVLIISKKHYHSYFALLDDQTLRQLIIAAKKVAKLMDNKLPSSSRCCLVFEGFEVNHIHAKIYPSYNLKSLKAISDKPTYQAEDKQLEKFQQILKS